jgi:hypothetical protein
MTGTAYAEQTNLRFGDAMCKDLDVNGSFRTDDLAC